MTNMGYCRFQNTVQDLLDCEDNWNENLSDEERSAQKHLLNICQRIVDDYGEVN